MLTYTCVIANGIAYLQYLPANLQILTYLHNHKFDIYDSQALRSASHKTSCRSHSSEPAQIAALYIHCSESSWGAT